MTATARIRALAEKVIAESAVRGVRIATAESCTGGMVAAALTDVAGSSAVFERGFVTYSNEAKMELLGVAPALLEANGAVSGEVARAMAKGAVRASRADLAVAITGVAGPAGGSPEKPVGLVWFGLAARGGATRIERRLFAGGSRGFVRIRSVEAALLLLLRAQR